jgi:hypothetical protein
MASPWFSSSAGPGGKGPVAGLGQARSHAFWIKPAYYVITDSDFVAVYNYQDGAVPDVKVLEVKRPEIRERFDQMFSVLNPRAAKQTRIDKIARHTVG